MDNRSCFKLVHEDVLSELCCTTPSLAVFFCDMRVEIKQHRYQR